MTREREAEIEHVQAINGPRGREDAASPFDFNRLDRISPSHLRAIELLHETLAQDLAPNLASYLRTPVSVKVVALEQSSSAKFLAGIAAPTCIVNVGLDPYEGSAVIELNSTLTFNLVELLLGGNGKTRTNIQRKLTEIEKSLMHSLMRVVLSELSAAWKSIATISFELRSLESEPQHLQVLAPAEATLILTFEVQTRSSVGLMRLAIPSIFIRRLRHKFNQLSQAQHAKATAQDRNRVAHLIQPTTLDFEAHISGGTVSPRRLLDLDVGDVLVLEHPLERKVTGTLNGLAKWLGRVVSRDERLLFEVEEQAVRPRTI